MNTFDLVIIGSGAAGFSASSRALDYKKNVCIIETGEIGGAGIMNGALVSKTLWELSSDYAIASKVNRGYRASALLMKKTDWMKFLKPFIPTPVLPKALKNVFVYFINLPFLNLRHFRKK